MEVKKKQAATPPPARVQKSGRAVAGAAGAFAKDGVRLVFNGIDCARHRQQRREHAPRRLAAPEALEVAGGVGARERERADS